jgi:hypothetical protein
MQAPTGIDELLFIQGHGGVLQLTEQRLHHFYQLRRQPCDVYPLRGDVAILVGVESAEYRLEVLNLEFLYDRS